LALEKQGFAIQRLALRGWDEKLIDLDDIAEQQKTTYVLKDGAISLLLSAVKVLAQKPLQFFCALWLAIKMGIRSDRPMPFHLIYFLEACQVYLEAKQFNSQHLHAHFGTNPSEIVMLVNALCGLPYSFTVHGPEEFDRPQFLKLAEKINRAKFVVAISSFGRSQLMRWVDFSQWNKIKIVHCGLEASFYNVAAVAVPAAPRLVCVGRLCEQKGQLLLIEAAKNLNEQQIDFELILAGDGEMRAKIESLMMQYGLQDKVKITGWISSAEVRSIILSSQMLVLPSFAEGLPVVIMEAMSLRRPVISTYIAGIPELLIHRENGWLCVAGDVNNLTDTMRKALSTPNATLQKMGDAAYARVVDRHNIDMEAAKLAEHFRIKSN
ncbi:MAG: glycosyltransferase family 4 protein, partial [Bdellovibrio sp.]|nr:glycosyltransferase family 4 protein [Methylotenera sp.]